MSMSWIVAVVVAVVVVVAIIIVNGCRSQLLQLFIILLNCSKPLYWKRIYCINCASHLNLFRFDAIPKVAEIKTNWMLGEKINKMRLEAKLNWNLSEDNENYSLCSSKLVEVNDTILKSTIKNLNITVLNHHRKCKYLLKKCPNYFLFVAMPQIETHRDKHIKLFIES